MSNRLETINNARYILDAGFTTLFIHLQVRYPEILKELMDDESTEFGKARVEIMKKAMKTAFVKLD
jgi:hypothetical protein